MTESDLVRASADFDGWDPSSIFSGDSLSSTRRTIENFSDDDDSQGHTAVKRKSIEKDLEESDHLDQQEMQPIMNNSFRSTDSLNNCKREIADIAGLPLRRDDESCDLQGAELTKKELEIQGNRNSKLLAESRGALDTAISGRLETSEEKDCHEEARLDLQRETEAKLKKEKGEKSRKHSETRKNREMKMMEMRKIEEKQFREVEERLIREENERIHCEEESVEAREREDCEGRELTGQNEEKLIMSDDESLIYLRTNTSNSAERIGVFKISKSRTQIEKEEEGREEDNNDTENQKARKEKEEVTADDDSLEHSSVLGDSSKNIPRNLTHDSSKNIPRNLIHDSQKNIPRNLTHDSPKNIPRNLTHDMMCELADSCNLDDSLVVRHVVRKHENDEGVRNHSDYLSNSAPNDFHGDDNKHYNSCSDEVSINGHREEMNVVKEREEDGVSDTDNYNSNDGNDNNHFDDDDDHHDTGDVDHNEINNDDNDNDSNNSNDSDNTNLNNNNIDDNPHKHFLCTAPHSIWLRGSAARTIQRIYRGLVGRYIIKMFII